MQQIEIGRGRYARRAYGFDDIAIVPSRRTRDPQDVDVSFKLADGHEFSLPVLASAIDPTVSPAMAGEMARLGGLAVLNVEGLWARYEDAAQRMAQAAQIPAAEATGYLQDLYAGAPVDPELVALRVREMKQHGAPACAAMTPQSVGRLLGPALDAGLDILVIQGTVVSAEHVSEKAEPLNLKTLIPSLDIPVIVGGCASYEPALHLMRAGASAVLVGVGPGAICTTRGVIGVGVPQATAIADVAAARGQHLLETGQHSKVIADGGMRTGGDISKAVACGADAVMLGSALAYAAEAPGCGFNWGMATFHPDLPRGTRVATPTRGSLQEILTGPARVPDGSMNLVGALRTSMATCGYKDILEFQHAELLVAPALQSEGKTQQRAQGVGMGARG